MSRGSFRTHSAPATSYKYKIDLAASAVMLTRQSTVSSYCGKFDGESIGILSVKKNVNVPKRCALLTENNKEFLRGIGSNFRPDESTIFRMSKNVVNFGHFKGKSQI